MTNILQVVTPTGGRPEGFALCQRWLRAQTYSGHVNWFIVDDCDPQTIVQPMPKNWTVEVIRPDVKWKLGQNTQARNMMLLLSKIDSELPVVFVEDDEVYAPSWLQRVSDALETHDLVGQAVSRKYNIATRRAMDKTYSDRSSLCSTAVRGAALRRFRSIAQRGPLLMDMELWKKRQNFILLDGADVVSMKCVPGRAGIDSGHFASFGEIEDPTGSLLREWIGASANEYLALAPNTPRHRFSRWREASKGKHAMKHTREGEVARYIEAHDDPKRRMHMGRRRLEDVRRILEGLPRGSLLDVGTGGGECLDMAASIGHEPTGCDANPKVASDRVVTCCAHSLPFDNGSFDHVTCFDVLEHLTEDDIRPALREMFRVARQTVTVSASELPSPDGKGGDFHISKRPRAQWLALIRECWGAGTQEFGTAGRSPAFRVVKSAAE